MRLKVALATAALALVAATSAMADQLPLTVQFTGASTTPLGTTAYSGIIFNNTSTDYFIGADSIAVATGTTVAFDGLTDPVLGAITDPAGLKIGAGDSLQFDDLFELSAPSLGEYALFSPDGALLSDTGFTSGGLNVPEPGTVAMLVSSGLVGSGFLVRRRRVRK
jgi:hypothetical protein